MRTPLQLYVRHLMMDKLRDDPDVVEEVIKQLRKLPWQVGGMVYGRRDPREVYTQGVLGVRVGCWWCAVAVGELGVRCSRTWKVIVTVVGGTIHAFPNTQNNKQYKSELKHLFVFLLQQ